MSKKAIVRTLECECEIKPEFVAIIPDDLYVGDKGYGMCPECELNQCPVIVVKIL